jgi:hypothetical protein
VSRGAKEIQQSFQPQQFPVEQDISGYVNTTQQNESKIIVDMLPDYGQPSNQLNWEIVNDKNKRDIFFDDKKLSNLTSHISSHA